MNLTCVISSMGCGGAERVMAGMANYWAARGHRIELLTLADGRPFYFLDPRVRHRGLGLMGQSSTAVDGLRRNLRRIAVLRRAIRELQPDAVISFMDRTNVLTLLATRGLAVPVVASERTDAPIQRIGYAWAALRRLAYRCADALVYQSVSARTHASKFAAARVRVIPNPVMLSENGAPRAAVNGRHQVIGMGRFTEEKGFDLLLEAFSQVADRHPNWSLCVFGDGPLREELSAEAARAGLKNRVSFPGTVSDPFRVFRQADLFVLPSRFEGFPNALCEAMACGLPVVSFDCRSGPAEIVRDGIDGVLVCVGDVKGLASAMDRLMGDPAERTRLANRATEVRQRFGLDNVMGMWESLLTEIVSARKGF